ncbi:protein D3-like isoform X1 [Atheta coriaria]|uniref:protein D3-like isoform X1 n=1 Tax=Dalotia coriaria TaxID=877792 RepID=UPI0031F344E2
MMAVNIFKVLVISIIFGFAIGNPQEHHGHHDQKEENSVLKKMQAEGIVPDVIDHLPASQLSVTFGEHKVELGNELTPTQVKNAPTVQWEGEKNTYYTLAMVDPDAPSRKEPKFREVNHWLVVNIEGSKLAEGEVITAYLGSGPPKGTEKHRYVFLLFKQPKKLIFDHPKTGPLSREHRLNFNIRKFAVKYELGTPIAGNFYQAEWDTYVDERNKKIIS